MSNFDRSVDFLETNRYLEIMSKEKSRYLQRARSLSLPLHNGFDIFHRFRWVPNQSNAKPIKIQDIFKAFSRIWKVLFCTSLKLHAYLSKLTGSDLRKLFNPSRAWKHLEDLSKPGKEGNGSVHRRRNHQCLILTQVTCINGGLLGSIRERGSLIVHSPLPSRFCLD